MVLLKTTLVVFLAVACVSAINPTVAKQSQDHAEHETDLPVKSIKPLSSGNNTVLIPPTTPTSVIQTSTNSSTIEVEPTKNSTTTTPAPTTTPTTTTTPLPTTSSTTTTPSPTTSSTTTTPSSSTTVSPNVTTAVPPTPEPSPARSWDGPSFLGGMVLAFGIVAVGFVGYRFFYLGRGGAYHTL
uniref:Porimin n=1 Tax=Melanaphis sacchari TaxID=742174 RepID=A0A2H8TJ43_9HEMI